MIVTTVYVEKHKSHSVVCGNNIYISDKIQLYNLNMINF